MEKAIAYIRVSTERQVTDGSSLDTQKRRIVEYAALKGYEVVKLFIEEGESAKTDQRPVLQELLGFVRLSKGKVSVLIFPKVDRFARYTEDYHFLKRYLRDRGIRVESTDERFDDSPSGRFLESMLAATAQFDNDVRAERSTNAMKEAIIEGRWARKPPVGLRTVKVDGKTTAEIDPEKGPSMRATFERMAARAGSPEDIRRWLRTRGIKLSRSHFHRTFFNKLYIGIIEASGQTVRGKAPLLPLVTEEIFYLAQANFRPRTTPKVYQHDREDFPLRGTLRCATCLRYLTASWAKGRSAKYPYYRCLNCPGMNVPKVPVERFFLDDLAWWTDGLGIPIQDRRKLREQNASVRLEAENARQRLETEIRKIAELQGSLALKVSQGVIPDAIAKAQIADLDIKRRECAEDLDRLPKPEHSIDEVLEFGVAFTSELPKYWQSGKLPLKKQIQSFFYPDGATVLRNGQITTAKTRSVTGSRAEPDAQLSAAARSREKHTNHARSKQRNFTLVEQYEILCRIFREFSSQLSNVDALCDPNPKSNDIVRSGHFP